MIDKLINAFDLYEQYLNNKKISFSFLIDGEEEIIECFFKGHNFLHLTGVETKIKISPKNFYKKLQKNEIKENHIHFNQNSRMKLDVFHNLNFQLGTKIVLYRTNDNLHINFSSDHNIYKNSAILCIYNKSPKSLLKKNYHPTGEKLNGLVVHVENLD